MIFQEAAANLIPSAVKLKWMAPIFLAALEQSHMKGMQAASHSVGQWAAHLSGVQMDTKPSWHQALVSLLGHWFVGRKERRASGWPQVHMSGSPIIYQVDTVCAALAAGLS